MTERAKNGTEEPLTVEPPTAGVATTETTTTEPATTEPATTEPIAQAATTVAPTMTVTVGARARPVDEVADRFGALLAQAAEALDEKTKPSFRAVAEDVRGVLPALLLARELVELRVDIGAERVALRVDYAAEGDDEGDPLGVFAALPQKVGEAAVLVVVRDPLYANRLSLASGVFVTKLGCVGGNVVAVEAAK